LKLLAAGFALRAQVIESEGEQLALPLALENLFGRLGGTRLFPDWLELYAPAALLAVLNGMPAGSEAFDGHAQISAERRLERVEAAKKSRCRAAAKTLCVKSCQT
jgi:hypothetical protein